MPRHIFQDLISHNKYNSLSKPSVPLCESSVSLCVMKRTNTEVHREAQRNTEKRIKDTFELIGFIVTKLI